MLDRDKRRAYLDDGHNGIRSGPVRRAQSRELLREDLRILREHAQSEGGDPELNSGIIAPGHPSWNDLPADSVVVEHWKKEIERIKKEIKAAKEAARERRRKRERKARERKQKAVDRMIRDMNRDVHSRDRNRLDRDMQREEAGRTA